MLNNPLIGFSEDHSHIYKVSNVKTLYLGSVVNTMSHNTAYDAGTLPEKYRPIHDTVNFYQYGNGRYYNITINLTGEVFVTCTTNSLPSDGKPHIGTCVTYV